MILGYALAAFTIIVWGITFVCTKYLLIQFTALEILFYRFFAAYIGLWIIHPKWEKIARKDNLWFALAGLTGVVLYQYSENLAVNFTTASNVSVIVGICPLFTALFAQIFLKEKHLSFFFLLGFAISITGVALISFNGKTNLSLNPKGDLLAFMAAACWGFYSLFVSIINRKNYDGLCATRRIFFFAVIFMIPLVLLGTQTGTMHFEKSIITEQFSNPYNLMNLLFLGLVASGFCFWAWNKACRIVGTVKTSKGLYLIPVVTIIFAFFVLDEKITWMGIAGTIITIAGLFISGIKQKK